MRDDHTEVLRERRQQPEFQRREAHVSATAARSASFQIDDRGPEAQDRVPGGSPHGVPQRRAYARKQLADAERLGHVVVGAGVECFDLCAFLDAGGQHDDRHRGPRANAADHLDAVDVRQPQVDNGEIRLVRSGVDGSATSCRRLDHPIALRAERSAQEPPDFGFVLDDEDRRAQLRIGHVNRTRARSGRKARVPAES